MEPQDLADRELRAIKKRLCYISSTFCALCLVCTAATLVLLLSHRMGSPSEEAKKEHLTQRRDNCTQLLCRTTVHAQLKWCTEEKNVSTTLLWEKDSPLNGIKYQDGNLTILTKGLYFINCHLHFVIKDCLAKDEDLLTNLILNGRPVHAMLHTMLSKNNTNCSKIYRDQHFSLQIELNVSDNVSIETNHAHWLNDEVLAGSIVFGAFML